jgi:hypothetical protein
MAANRQRDFTECAIFPHLDGVSVSFAFEISPPAREARSTRRRSAFRLLALSERLEQSFGGEDDLERRAGARRAHDELIEPVRSFLDDVTNGQPGVNGRPLLLLASGAEPESPSRRVLLRRPARWLYQAEGDDTVMTVPDSLRAIPLLLRDSFCVFESGLVYYVLTLVEPLPSGDEGTSCPALDEYSLLQLQQLLLDRSRLNDPDYLTFDWQTERGLPFLAFASARLRSLAQVDCSTETGKPLANAILDILQPFGLLRQEDTPLLLGDRRLVSLCMGIDDESMQAIAGYAINHYAGESIDWPSDHSDRKSAAWRARAAEQGIAATALHGPEEDENERGVLAVAGLATGVCDFPFQDKSEIHDSTRPARQSPESALFTHPRFMLEIGTNWRSFQRGVETLGGCPYLLLTWLTTVHDQQIVLEMEHDLEDLIYGSRDRRTEEPDDERFRTAPLADVMELLESSSKLWGRKTGVQEYNLRERLEIFRWQSIHRCGNIFRYPKEKAALGAVRDKLGIEDRFNEVHQTLDRLENLVDDVATLSSAYAERYTNRALGVLTLLGVISIPSDIIGLWTSMHSDVAWGVLPLSLIIIAVMAIIYFVRPRGPAAGR